MRLVPTPRPAVDAVTAGPWTPVDVDEHLDQPFRMLADHVDRSYDSAFSATFNDHRVLAFRMSYRLGRTARPSWSTTFRLRTCVLAELHDPVPNLRISNRTIHDIETTVFDGVRRVRGTPHRFRQVFSARTRDRAFAHEVLDGPTCSLLLAEPAFTCLECLDDRGLFVFDGDADRDHAVAFVISFVDRLRAGAADTGFARVRAPGA
jgi:hypothetical protein